MKIGKKTIIFFIVCIISVAAASCFFPAGVFSQTKEELETELSNIEAQIAEYEKEITKTKTEKQTLANKISQLKKEQEKTQLQIKAISVEIKTLDATISTTQSSIQDATERLSMVKDQIANILQALHEQDQRSMTEIFFSEGGFPALFSDLESLQKLSQGLADKMNEIRGVKEDLESQYSELEVKQGEKKNFLAVQVLQRQSTQAKANEQSKLLKETQGRESRYQAMLTDSQKRAREIKGRIYELIDARVQITFGDAVGIAEWASEKTGVRPALILAILTQESNLGKNIGTCNRPGDPPSKSWKVIMKPTRDQEPFLAVTRELGLDPDVTPVSCPMKAANGSQLGWGGAMGPAQFIPSTWVLYKNKVAEMTGITPANPWDMRDAFIATALLMKDNGATANTADAEWKAAMRYFSGSTNVKYRFYGDSVLALAQRYEDDIRTLKQQ
ncbi:MAG: hypothetical protein NUV61_04335 [Candidatus Azambacteria bacterium]|nr:hypothetical protein [Candidatus Azambacteria bacterium]